MVKECCCGIRWLPFSSCRGYSPRVEAFSCSLFMVSQIVTKSLFDLLYRLDSSCEHRNKLNVGGGPPYPHQLVRSRHGLLLPRAFPLAGRIMLTCARLGREAGCGFIASAVRAAIASSRCCVLESQSFRSGGTGHQPPSSSIP